MLTLTTISPCSLMPASDASQGVDRRMPMSAEALIASLVAHLRDKTLNDTQCVAAIKTMLNQVAND